MRSEKKDLTRSEKSALTKHKIVDAAAQIMKEEGYVNLTVRKICMTAGVSTGSFYHFYKTKDDLVSEFLIQEEWARDMEDPDDIIEYTLFGYRKLICAYEKLGVDFTSNYYTADNQIFNVYSRKSGSFTSYLIRRRMYAAREKGLIREGVEIERLLYGIQTMFIGNVFQWCVMKGAVDIHLEVDRMLRDYLWQFVTEKYRQKYAVVV